jgi:hypothetical protein
LHFCHRKIFDQCPWAAGLPKDRKPFFNPSRPWTANRVYWPLNYFRSLLFHCMHSERCRGSHPFGAIQGARPCTDGEKLTAETAQHSSSDRSDSGFWLTSGISFSGDRFHTIVRTTPEAFGFHLRKTARLAAVQMRFQRRAVQFHMQSNDLKHDKNSARTVWINYNWKISSFLPFFESVILSNGRYGNVILFNRLQSCLSTGSVWKVVRRPISWGWRYQLV